jgi:hypothetical protein
MNVKPKEEVYSYSIILQRDIYLSDKMVLRVCVCMCVCVRACVRANGVLHVCWENGLNGLAGERWRPFSSPFTPYALAVGVHPLYTTHRR